ncbi:hypothetical protein TCT1_20110 [Xenorhabdus sp. TCT-1]|uniref:Uncharacterized protein n=1 Tax=Xenorhabdus taiwanensis TaxID=3085177 RepID=A0ABN7C421_9GAMM|nr:hypothetical protein TCT1_20110 [Xenorhabdus sp. TCT-1]
MVTLLFANTKFDEFWACLNLSGVTIGKDARASMNSAPDVSKKPLDFNKPS